MIKQKGLRGGARERESGREKKRERERERDSQYLSPVNHKGHILKANF